VERECHKSIWINIYLKLNCFNIKNRYYHCTFYSRCLQLILDSILTTPTLCFSQDRLKKTPKNPHYIQACKEKVHSSRTIYIFTGYTQLMLLPRQTREEPLKIHFRYKQAKRSYTPQERYYIYIFTGYTHLMLLPIRTREKHLKVHIIYKQAKRRYTLQEQYTYFLWHKEHIIRCMSYNRIEHMAAQGELRWSILGGFVKTCLHVRFFGSYT